MAELHGWRVSVTAREPELSVHNTTVSQCRTPGDKAGNGTAKEILEKLREN